jgi:hypothetical protein
MTGEAAMKPKIDSSATPLVSVGIDHAFFAFATNYLIDLDHAVIVDVEASRAIRQAEVGAARTMIERAQDRFGLYPARLAADHHLFALSMRAVTGRRHSVRNSRGGIR